MRNTLFYLFALLILGAGVWYFLFRENDAVFDSAEAGFAVRDTAGISRIYLSDKTQSVTLTRTPAGWRLNDSFEVLPASLNTLMQALYGQQAIAPVPKEAHNNVVRALSVSSIKAEIYGRNGQKIRSFFVGNEAFDLNNTYMLMEGASRPYVVGLRGFEGFLTPRYSPRFYDWRDRTVFRIAPEQIRQVAITYPDGKGAFQIHNEAGSPPRLTPLLTGATPDPSRLQDYLGFFRQLNCESYVNGTLDLDSIIRHAPPVAVIRVEPHKGPVQEARLFRMESSQRTTPEAMLRVNGRDYDIDRYYAVRNGRDTMVVQDLSFGKLLQEPEAFYPALNPIDTTARQKP